MDEMGDLLNRVLRGPQFYLANPAVVARLYQAGASTKVDVLPYEDALEKLFEVRKHEAREIGLAIPGCPTWEFNILGLYDEIRQCALFGLNGAAITLCGVLVEFAMKCALFTREKGARVQFDSEEWSEYEEFQFGAAIRRARKAGLIDEGQEASLTTFKDHVRNPYAHYNLQKLTTGAVFHKVKIKDFDTGHEEERDIPASESPSLQAIAKQVIDKQELLKQLEYTVTVVGHFVAEMEKDWAREKK